MLEQLKDMIIEMELLLKDCCSPILQTNNVNISLEENSDKIIVNNETKKRSFKEPTIRIDPCLRKILAAPFSVETYQEETTAEKSTKNKFSVYKLKLQNIPSQYQSIFFPEYEMDDNIHLDDNFPVKVEVESEIKHNTVLSNIEHSQYSNFKLPPETCNGSYEENSSSSSTVSLIDYALFLLSVSIIKVL